MLVRLALSLATASLLHAQVPPDFPKPKEVAPGIFEIGAVRLDRNASTVTFPAKVNMNDGLVEYLLVKPDAAVHESVLTTEVQPQEVHVAMLLLGAKGMQKPEGASPVSQINAEYLARAPKLTGDRITLSAKWKDKDGKDQTAPAERWLTRKLFVPKKPVKYVPAEEGPWLYTGSFFHEGRFVAQGDGTFVALVTYPSALMNNPRTGSTDDQMWFANKETVPPVGTPVEFSIKLEPQPKPASPK